MSRNDESDNEGMDKYGVDEAGSGVKTADAHRGHCPQCGTPLTRSDKVNVLHCPKCGTRPFEGSQ